MMFLRTRLWSAVGNSLNRFQVLQPTSRLACFTGCFNCKSNKYIEIYVHNSVSVFRSLKI